MRARTTELAVTGLAPLSYNVAHCCQYSSPAKALVAIPAIWLGRTSYGFGAATRTPRSCPLASSSGKTIPASSKADWIAHQSRDVAHSSRRGRLFGLFWPLTLAQSNTCSTAVLIDEVDAGNFQGPPNRQVVSSRHGRLAVG